jgi:hypothetical protein
MVVVEIFSNALSALREEAAVEFDGCKTARDGVTEFVITRVKDSMDP